MAKSIKSALTGVTTAAATPARWVAVGVVVTVCHAGAALAQASSPIAGPSFDCGSATTPTERQICLVPDLSRLDIEISTAYSDDVASLDPRHAVALKAAQRLWLRQRDACRDDGSCLQWSMNKRIAQLLANAPPKVLASVLESGGVKPEEDAPVQPVVPTVLPAQAGDEWRGAYTCGDEDYYMRLRTTEPLDSSTSVVGTIEFGPSLEAVSARGSFRVAGQFSKPDGILHVEPQGWVHQARPPRPMFGLDGKQSGGDLFTGTVAGLPQCTAFRAWHHQPPRTQNPNGLVLRTSEPGDDDCRNYATWVSSGRQLQFGSYFVSSLVFDTAGQLRVLGHTADEWTTADASKYQDVVNTCQRTLSSSDDPDDTDLLQKAGLFTIAPFDQDPANWKVFGWDRVHEIVVLRADAERQAAGRLERLAALPRNPSSVPEYNQEVFSARNPGGDLRYLEKGERDAYVAELLSQQQALEPATAQSTPTMPSVASDNPNPNPLGAILLLGIVAALSHHSGASSQSDNDDALQQQLDDQTQRANADALAGEEQQLQDQEAEEDREQQIRDENQDPVTTQIEINNSRAEYGQ